MAEVGVFGTSNILMTWSVTFVSWYTRSIPNTEAKPSRADGTAWVTAWEPGSAEVRVVCVPLRLFPEDCN